MRGRIGVEVVPHEDQVEATLLGQARDVHDAVDVLEAVHRAGNAPAGDMAAGAQQEQAEMHLSWHAHRQKMSRRSAQPTRPKKPRLSAEATTMADQTWTKSICTSTTWAHSGLICVASELG
jgi:uncharacterized protein YecA (UPF0149 family)